MSECRLSQTIRMCYSFNIDNCLATIAKYIFMEKKNVSSFRKCITPHSNFWWIFTAVQMVAPISQLHQHAFPNISSYTKRVAVSCVEPDYLTDQAFYKIWDLCIAPQSRIKKAPQILRGNHVLPSCWHATINRIQKEIH